MPTFELRPGTRLGAYRIVRTLGRGGMGVVHEALEEGTNRTVAVKVLSPDVVRDARLMARFRREDRALRAVAHANVVGVLATGEDQGVVFLVLELAPGGSLADRLKRGPLPWREVSWLGAQIARALGAVHAAGLVHRDVKPANVLLDAAGRVKLTDFGLVRPEKENLAETIASLTGSQEIVGTFDFMAPEQTEGGGKNVDARTDLYALGVTLHVLLTGRPLFEGSGYSLVRAHLMATPSPPSASVKGIPSALDALVLQLLAKKKEDRPASALEVATRLESLGRAGEARSRRGPLAAAICVLALGGAVAAWRLAPAPAVPAPSPPAPPEPPPAAQPPAPPPPARPRRAPAIPPIDIARIAPQRRWWGSHRDAIWNCAFTPDGRTVATASGDGTIGIWDATRVEAGKTHETLEPMRLEAHQKVTWCVGFTADGRRLVSAGHGGKVVVWDADTWKTLDEVTHHAGSGARLEALAVSSETPARVLVGAQDGSLELFRLAKDGTLTSQRTFQAHSKLISCVAFWPDERHALSGAGDGLVETDLETGESKEWSSWTHQQILPALAVSPDGETILTAGWDRFVGEVWDASGAKRAELPGHAYVIRSVAISPDGAIAATGSTDGMVKLWRTDVWTEIVTLSHGITESIKVGALAFSPDGKSLVTASEIIEGDSFGRGLVNFWDLVPP